AVEDALAKARGPDALRQLLARERHGFLRDAESARDLHVAVDRRVLARRGRDSQHPALAEPGVDPVGLAERAHPGNDRLGDPRDLEGALVAELLVQAWQVAPVAVDEAAVPAARGEPALVRLAGDDRETRLALLRRAR